MHAHQYDDERVVILTPLAALCVLPYFDVAAHGPATVNRLADSPLDFGWAPVGQPGAFPHQ
jgi:hypothetical protein